MGHELHTAHAFSPPTLVFRDQQTLELRQFYALPKGGGEPLTYTLDAYFFFPRSFGVGPQTWSRDIFYRNTNILTRMHAPGLSLRQLQNVQHPHNPACLLLARIKGLTSGRAAHLGSLTALAQIFGAEITDAVRAQTHDTVAALRACGTVDPTSSAAVALRDMVENLIVQTESVLAALRRVRGEAMAYQGVAPPKLIASLNFAEEYTAAVVDESLSEVAHAITRCAGLYNGSCMAQFMRSELATALEELSNRRRISGFVRPRPQDKEYYGYKIGLLKKELQRSLYVDTRLLDTDSFVANSAAMAGAGLAATWTALAQIPLVTQVMKGSNAGILAASLLGIGAYILKDRIKDWARQRLSRSFTRWDHAAEMTGELLAKAGLGAFGGSARERLRWLREGTVPEAVSQLRHRERTVRGVSIELEQVMLYRRFLHLTPSQAKTGLPAGYGLEEMLRINLDDILRRLDDPQHAISYYRGGGRFGNMVVPKVYHLNIVTVAQSHTHDTCYMNRARVVLNKERILRIEHL